MPRMRDKTLSRNPSPNPARGFTLIEIILAVLLFTIGVVAISQALNTGILASSDAENVDLGLNIAQAKMEELKGAAFASLSSSGPAADSNFSNFNVTVAVTGTDPKTIDVTVAWNVQGQAASTSVALTTLRANY